MRQYGTMYEGTILSEFAEKAKLGIIEIGVLNGETTNLISQVAKVSIFGIDPLIPDSMNPELIGSASQIRENMKKYPHGFYFFQRYSHDMAARWTVEFDMIFVDGDHTYKGVKQDYEDWWPKLEVGGIMLFHDSAPVASEDSSFKGHAGPTKLVNELKKTHECIGVWDTITGIKKI